MDLGAAHANLTSMPKRWAVVTNLKFNGDRFEDHSFQFDVATELVTFQRLVTSVAGAIWRYQNPKRERLPKNFDESTKLRFRMLEEGSVMLPTETLVDDEQSLFGLEPSPQVALAIDWIQAVVQSQEHDQIEIPAYFPRDLIPDIARLGQSLLRDESLDIIEPVPPPEAWSSGVKRARVTQETHYKLERYNEAFYDDMITLFGEVRTVDLDKSSSRIRLQNQHALDVRFYPEQKELFKSNLEKDVKLTGLAEISTIDGVLRKIKSVTQVESLTAMSSDSEQSLGAWIERNAGRVDWSVVPTDYARNLDRYLYGKSDA